MAIGLGVSLKNSFPIIIATAFLHNIARRSGESTPPNDNMILNPVSWEAVLAQGNINNLNVNAVRTQRIHPTLEVAMKL